MPLNFSTKHEGETTVYTTCCCNCGGNHYCVIKAHVKEGRVVAVEPDDRYNTNVGREDETLSEQDLIKTRLQRRPCTMGLAFHQYIYHPNRILYPLKRAPDTRRGEGKYVRIAWDEALTTIADRINEVRDKYGPYSIRVYTVFRGIIPFLIAIIVCIALLIAFPKFATFLPSTMT